MAAAWPPAAAYTAPLATLHVALTPERLGQATSMAIGLDIATPTDGAPPALTEVELLEPDIGITVSGLGLSTCSRARLEALGPQGCPPDSWMGRGSALAEIPVGPTLLHETANVAVVRAPEADGHLALLFYASGEAPAIAQVIFSGLLLPAPDSERVQIELPLVPSFPGAPDVAFVKLRVTLGPDGLIYYERVRGKVVRYRPQGILLPDRCPRGGFPFAASLTFVDGSHVSTATTVPCPKLDWRSRSRRVLAAIPDRAWRSRAAGGIGVDRAWRHHTRGGIAGGGRRRRAVASLGHRRGAG